MLAQARFLKEVSGSILRTRNFFLLIFMFSGHSGVVGLRARVRAVHGSVYAVWDAIITAISTTSTSALSTLSACENPECYCSGLIVEATGECMQMRAVVYARVCLLCDQGVSLVTGGHVMVPYRFTVHVPVRNHATEL